MKGHILSAVVIIALMAAPAMGAEKAKTTKDPKLDNFSKILKSDIKAQKEEIMKKSLQLKDEEYEKFLRIYREYQAEAAKLREKKAALEKEFSSSLKTMTDAQAKEHSKKVFALEDEKSQLKKSYFSKIESALSSIPAVKFFETESALSHLEELQDSAGLPPSRVHYGSFPGGNPPPEIQQP
jgi:hypothetical protein